MMKRTLIASVLTAALFLPAAVAGAADQQQIYGSQLMTQQERNEYSARMRAAKTAAEREQIRLEHHAQMTERARARGMTLPDEPSGRGRGGPGMGQGGGMG
ncbi:MAG: hypothetical protein IH605_11955, partial [Burkholderiales bacterium]|nr:hypothetical protein [Burkholderiales bacterium]